jgi:hypothetical protein
MQTVLAVLGILVAGYFIRRLLATPGPVRYARVQLPPLDDTLPPAGESARKAAESVRAFGALVDRLAARDIAVYDMVCEPATRWSLTVQGGAEREKEVTRVSWRAGDPDLHVAKSALIPNLFPNRWHQEPGMPVGLGGDAAAAVEALLVERLAKGTGGDGARESAAFVRELVAFADRLAARGICVRKLSCGPSWFWELVLQPGAEADQGETAGQTGFTRVFWSVRENDVSVESSPVLPEPVPDTLSPGSSASAPTGEQVRELMASVNPWTPESRTKIGRTGDAIGVAEDLLTRRFSGSAGTNSAAG